MGTGHTLASSRPSPATLCYFAVIIIITTMTVQLQKCHDS